MTRGKPLSFDRNEVLTQAMELFWEKGYQMTSMTDLLERMGIQRQSFYNTFGSKEKIFIEAVTLYTRTRSGQIAALLAAPGNPLDNVRQVFRMWQEMSERKDGCGCMLGNSIAEFGLNHPDISNLLKDEITRLENAFHGAFARAAAEGYLPEGKDPKALARSLVVMSQGMALLSKLGYGNEMISDVMKTTEALLIA